MLVEHGLLKFLKPGALSIYRYVYSSTIGDESLVYDHVRDGAKNASDLGSVLFRCAGWESYDALQVREGLGLLR